MKISIQKMFHFLTTHHSPLTHQNAISWFESNWCLHKIGKYFALLLGFMQLIIRIDQIGQFIDVIQPIEDWNELSGIGESFDSKIQIALPNNVSRKNQNIIMNELIFILANKTIITFFRIYPLEKCTPMSVDIGLSSRDWIFHQRKNEK